MSRRGRTDFQWTLWLAPVITAAGTATGVYLFKSSDVGASYAYLTWAFTAAVVFVLFFVFTRDHWQDT